MAVTVEATDNAINQQEQIKIDSKYRLIILAALRSKQLVRGARPRVEMDPQRHKATRIALEEFNKGKVNFEIIDED